jgi:hypothetical protein
MLATAKINPKPPQNPINKPRFIPYRLSDPWPTDANKYPKSIRAIDEIAQMAMRCLFDCVESLILPPNGQAQAQPPETDAGCNDDVRVS